MLLYVPNIIIINEVRMQHNMRANDIFVFSKNKTLYPHLIIYKKRILSYIIVNHWFSISKNFNNH